MPLLMVLDYCGSATLLVPDMVKTRNNVSAGLHLHKGIQICAQFLGIPCTEPGFDDFSTRPGQTSWEVHSSDGPGC